LALLNGISMRYGEGVVVNTFLLLVCVVSRRRRVLPWNFFHDLHKGQTREESKKEVSANACELKR